MAFTKITQALLNSRGTTTLPNKPVMSTQKLKEEFDAPAKQIVAPALNNLIDELEDSSAAATLGAVDPKDSSTTAVQNILNRLTQDVTSLDADKHNHANKDVLDTITEDVVMDADYVHTDNNFTDAEKDLVASAVQDPNYVHTDNNYTNSEKNKLATIDEYANNYVLPPATNVLIGGVKPDGSTTTVDTDGTIRVIGGGGGGAADAFKTISANGTDIVANGEDTLKLVQGANVTLTPNPVTKEVMISATGGSGGGGGDMYMAVYDSNGDGIVNAADTINGLTADVTELNYVKGVTSGVQSQLDALSTTVGTKADKTVTSALRTDVDTLIDKAQNLDSNGKISASNVLDTDGVTPITDKLSVLDNVADTREKIENATESADVVASAMGVQNFANTFSKRLRIPLGAGKNMIGQWQDVDKSEFKSHDDSGKANFLFAPCLYFEDSDIPLHHDVQLDFGYDTESGQSLILGGYQFWSNPKDSSGNPIVDSNGNKCGGICIMLANEETDAPTDITVEIKFLNREEEVVVWND